MDTIGSLPCSEALDTGPYFILNQINPADISPQCLFIIRFYIAFPSIPRIYTRLFHLYYQTHIPPSPFCFVFYMCYMSYPYGYSNNDESVGIWNSPTVTVISNSTGILVCCTPVYLSKVWFT
jgi:hypothetical protein